MSCQCRNCRPTALPVTQHGLQTWPPKTPTPISHIPTHLTIDHLHLELITQHSICYKDSHSFNSLRRICSVCRTGYSLSGYFFILVPFVLITDVCLAMFMLSAPHLTGTANFSSLLCLYIILWI